MKEVLGSAAVSDGSEILDADNEPPSLKWQKRKGRAVMPAGMGLDDVGDVFHDSKTLRFREEFYPRVTDRQWNSWTWQLKNRIRNATTLSRFMELTPTEFEATRAGKYLPFAITPYYLSLIVGTGPENPLRKTVIPTLHELRHSVGESEDPLAEDSCSPVSGIVHRYPDRALFLATDYCATYCRYCTRSRMVGKDHQCGSPDQWQKGIDYIRNHPEIRDVLISGGDPLTLPDDRLGSLLASLRAIPHVEVLRIGTKVPVVLPQRITRQLVDVLKAHHPLWLSIHFTHPDELTPETRKAVRMLADAGIPLGSQTVLLKGVNDDTNTMKRLFQSLMRNRVKPYYLYQCDPIVGSSHFRTRVEQGLNIIQGLRGFTSGYAIPHFVIDAPGGGGKIPLLPEYCVKMDSDSVVLKNYEGKTFVYPQPRDC